MPCYYFHLVTPEGVAPDEIGTSFASADHAMAEAWRAVGEISADLLRQGLSPYGYRFEVADVRGVRVFDLPFSEMNPRVRAPPHADQDLLRTRVSETLNRSRSLHQDVAAAVVELQGALARTRALLRSRGANKNDHS